MKAIHKRLFTPIAVFFAVASLGVGCKSASEVSPSAPSAEEPATPEAPPEKFTIDTPTTAVSAADESRAPRMVVVNSREATEEDAQDAHQAQSMYAFYLSNDMYKKYTKEGKNDAILAEKPYDLPSFKIMALDSLSRGIPEGTLILVETLREQKIELDEEALLLSGVAQLMLGDRSAGLATLEKAANLNPQNTLADLNIGLFHLAHGNAKEAVIHFTRVLRQDPSNPAAHLQVGVCFMHLKEPKRAEEHLTNATGSHSAKMWAWYYLGLLNQNFYRNKTKASRFYEMVIAAPDAPERLKGLVQNAINTMAQ